MSPFRAWDRKQIRHIPNFRRYARGRPHSRQRWYARTGNFGVRWAFAISDFFATRGSSPVKKFDVHGLAIPDAGHPGQDLADRQLRNGIPISDSRVLPSSLVRAVVTMTTSIPWTFSTLSYSISGKMNCSRIPRE